MSIPFDALQIAPGGFVLAVTEHGLVVVDDGAGRRDQQVVADVIAAAATGDPAEARRVIENAATTLPAAAALLRTGDQLRVLLLGPLTVVLSSEVAVVTLDTHGGLRRGVEELIVPAAARTLTIGPPGVPALTLGQGETPGSDSTRIGRLHVSLDRLGVVDEQPVAVNAEPSPLEAEQRAAARPAVQPATGPVQGVAPAADDAGPVARDVAPGADDVAPVARDLAPAADDVEPPIPPPRRSKPSPPAAAPTPPAAVVPAAPPADPSVETGGADEIGTVQVFGVRCPRDHHNHPDTVYCTQCGLRMGVNQTAVVGLGPRPALGLLLLDDGTTITLDRDLVIGREPQFHAVVTAGEADPVTVADPELNLSRAHLVVRLVEWDITVADLGSSNGTALLRKGAASWERLEPGSPVQLGAGDRLRAGSRDIRVEVHHLAG